MESPVVVDKPPEAFASSNTERGFPFDEEEGTSAWSNLATRRPDLAARLRHAAHPPPSWTTKRRPTAADDHEFGDFAEHFDRFPFSDIPPEFREHLAPHWGRRYEPREEQPPAPAQTPAATQTEPEQQPRPAETPQSRLPNYGLRNTVDLGQKSPADPGLVDADGRSQRSMSAPPAASAAAMSHPEPRDQPASNVRHIPIFVEGRDEPVINKTDRVPEHKPTYVPHPPHQAHPAQSEREQFFADEPPSYHPPPNFSRAFGGPFGTGFRQQPFTQQKAYPQSAFARENSPHRAQSPRGHDEPFVKVPVHHEQAAPGRTDHPPPPHHPQQQPQQHPPQQPKQQPQQHPPQQPQQPAPPPQQPEPKPQPPPSNDPITQILSIQTDVLNLMTEVENFVGTKADKRYMFLDEMLTRNLIKLDTIETDGKENIRLARKEAIKCIQKCIAVLEAKADMQSMSNNTPSPQDVEMNDKPAENGEQETKESMDSDSPKVDTQPSDAPAQPATEEKKDQSEVTNNESSTTNSAEPSVEGKDKKTTKKKVVKKRDKSKDSKEAAKEESAPVTETATVQVDEKGDGKINSQTMEVDGATLASQ